MIAELSATKLAGLYFPETSWHVEPRLESYDSHDDFEQTVRIYVAVDPNGDDIDIDFHSEDAAWLWVMENRIL
jgi:hypothetical protein